MSGDKAGAFMTEALRNGQHPAIGSQVRVPKMGELVASSLRRQIVRGDLAEGDALPSESELMQQFGVSRPTLREAFRVLESESLISVRRGAHGGAVVHVPNGDVAARYAALVLEHRGATLRDVYEARGVIEPGCVAQVARSRTQKQVATLHQALETSRKLRDNPVEQMAEQSRFHQLLVEMTGNQTLVVLSGMLRHIVDVVNLSHAREDAGTPAGERAMRKGFRAHERLVALIEERNAADAESLWRKHLLAADEYILEGSASLTVYDLMG
jgi:DNA-binding FadR family transcriptional regulator